MSSRTEPMTYQEYIIGGRVYYFIGVPLSMSCDMHTINLTFKCLKGSPPEVFKDYFKVFRTIHNKRGSGHNLLLPKVRTETARKSFYGSKLFISIATEVKDL